MCAVTSKFCLIFGAQRVIINRIELSAVALGHLMV